MPKAKSTLKRPICPMPPSVRKKIMAAQLLQTYKSRPAYQQNDYMRWITSARLDTTKERRTQQMLNELKARKLCDENEMESQERITLSVCREMTVAFSN